MKVAKIKDVFNLFDKDGDGDIPTQELGTALRALGTYPSQRELVEEFKNTEEVDFETFNSLLKMYFLLYVWKEHFLLKNIL